MSLLRHLERQIYYQATWVGVRRNPTQVAPTGQAVRVMVRHVRVMVRHVYIVPLESSHVEYP